MLSQIVNSWADRFEGSKYPRDFYLKTLSSISGSREPQKFGHLVVRMLQWKDGKVRLDPSGKINVNGVCYTASTAKPNTYDPKVHDSVLFSNRFCIWAQEVKRLHLFSPDLLSVVKDRFNLWSGTSLAIPAFLMHILNPQVFPIFDQHVERARRFLTCTKLNRDSVDVTIDDYIAYRSFWVELLSELGIDIETPEYGQVKRVDDALWAMGKHLKQMQKAHLSRPRPATTTATKKLDGGFNTGSPEFKNMALQYAGKMRQADAMKQAAEELGVRLPPSYLRYPASHINRWRQQGYPR